MATKKYPLGIAFSGGGAKAAAHCGALQALKEYGALVQVLLWRCSTHRVSLQNK